MNPSFQFDQLPKLIENLLCGQGYEPLSLAAAEQVVVVLIDGFGFFYSERLADHQLLNQMNRQPMLSQFPSTTTAQMTTLYTGLPVGQHGLYEWTINDPMFGNVQTLPMKRVVLGQENVAFTDTSFLPEQTLAETLHKQGLRSTYIHPVDIAKSVYSKHMSKGATILGYESTEDIISKLSQALQSTADYILLYCPEVDSAGHEHGPDSQEYNKKAVEILDAIDKAMKSANPNTTLLLCSDHGQINIGPEQIDFLDEIYPALTEQLTALPCGSSRDCFLHVQEPEKVQRELQRLLPKAIIKTKSEMLAENWFVSAGPQLLSRLADLVVLPEEGRGCWLKNHASASLKYLGMHGGRSQLETFCTLATLQS